MRERERERERERVRSRERERERKGEREKDMVRQIQNVSCRAHMRSPTNIVLLGMAVCDLATVFFPLPW